MNKCECDFCKKPTYKEHEEITCKFLKDSINNSTYKDKLLSDFKDENKKFFSYYIGAFWLNKGEEKYNKSIIIEPKYRKYRFYANVFKMF